MKVLNSFLDGGGLCRCAWTGRLDAGGNSSNAENLADRNAMKNEMKNEQLAINNDWWVAVIVNC
jgi:hypothetical protein